MNKINEEQYNFTHQEIEIIKRFNNEIIKKYIDKYKKVKLSNITDEMESNFLNSVDQFILTNFPDEEQKPENGNISKESIPLKNEETENEIINNLIESSNEQLEKKFDFSLNIFYIKFKLVVIIINLINFIQMTIFVSEIEKFFYYFNLFIF